MRIKKLLLLAVMPLLLTSCGKKTIAGTYGFQLGKEQGTHFGLFLDLFDEDYIDHPEIVGYKKLDLKLSLSFPQGDGQETMDVLSTFLDIFKDEQGNFILDGFYKLTEEKNKKNEKRISLGLEFTYLIQTFANIIKEQTGGELTPEMEHTLDVLNRQDLIESIIYATYANSTVNAYIPVSLDDVYYQLYWYGYDVKITVPAEDSNDFNLVIQEVTKHEYGTNPTADDVKTINETFENEHVDYYFKSYRAFNALKLSLAKKN